MPRRLAIPLLAVLLAVGAGVWWLSRDEAPAVSGNAAALGLVPLPTSVTTGDEPYVIDAATVIRHTETPEAASVAGYLAELLRPATGYSLPVEPGATESDGIRLQVTESGPPESYELSVDSTGISLSAATVEGLFRGVQTLRQLLPPAIEAATLAQEPWTVPAVRISDQPRFPHRGVMLDVARHFFTVDEVKALIDQVALYKINHLHLHLSDDQGWRIAIEGWPRLTEVGGATEVGGTTGGSYTQDDYRELVAYAKSRFITVVPEIDLPGHTNAALAAYGELSCDGQPTQPYTGIQVGFSAVCTDKEETYDFIDDVLGQLAALTPGPYLHIGGDEVETLSAEQYASFIARAQEAVGRHGKTVMAWHQIGEADPAPGAVLQYWGVQSADLFTVKAAVEAGASVVMTPADHAYLDMKYNATTTLGLVWAGTIDLAKAYEWDPETHLGNLEPGAVLGVEAALWTETLDESDDLEQMAFPRLPAMAEVGWSAQDRRDYDDFAGRLSAHGPRWTAMGIDFTPVSDVPWPAD